MKHCFVCLVLIALLSVQGAFGQVARLPMQGAFGQARQEKFDSVAVAKIKDEGTNHSKVMEILSYLSDVYGPRLTGSPQFMRAANWAMKEMSEFGLDNPHLEAWGPFGKGWSLKAFSATMTEPSVSPIIAYPKAWSPGTNGKVNAEVVFLDAKKDSTLEIYRGKLKNKIVMLSDPRELEAHFKPEGTRLADSTLLDLANADMQGRRGGFRFQMRADQRARAMLSYHKWQMCQEEGAAATLEISFAGDGGTVFVQGATVPTHPDTPFTKRVAVYDPKAPKILPQIVVAAEHYNRIIRMLAKGEQVKMEINLDVSFTKADSSYDIIAEIPGTDLKDEVVMVGGHFDSWQGGTGATDNGTGSAVSLEAMRILKALDLKPRRTIRVGLWGGEEEGLLGSAGYVKRHFGEREGAANEPTSKVTQKPEADKFSVYFNNDNGSGKVRGVYMQGNEEVRKIFRAWLAPFKDMGAYTLSISNTGGTDHLSFDAVGLPGFQFIQDPLEYGTRTHHSNMDVYDRAQEEDLKQASVIMAAFAYNAAMRDEKFPRKPLPQPQAPAPAGGR